jgi:transcriptional regulator of acetoin/glycerol metabolism/AraC-like DNA-binding protein
MRISERFARSIDMPARHAEHVYLVAEGNTPPLGFEEVSTSWQRCVNDYGVNPANDEAPRILTHHEIIHRRGPIEHLVFSAQEEIDRLFKLVGPVGYTVLFCDTTGAAVEHRGDDAEASQFQYWGTCLGGVWSEAIEGTNGIGTCIAEERPVTIHRTQHFRSRHVNLSCSGAPVFGADGRLMAVLDVSAIDPTFSEPAHALTGALTAMSARAIGERFFREQFRSAWIVAVAPPEDDAPGMLLAVDGNQRIVGADRAARVSLWLDDQRIGAGVSLWSLFERNLALFRHKDRPDIATRLVIVGTNEAWPALVTPPNSAGRNTTDAALHARPRLELLNTLRQPAPAPQARGGLPSHTMRRVCDYVDAHLSESIDLTELAAVAGLSLFHFAREFKQSAGVTPHYYLVRRRVERAHHMLARTALSLSEVALAAGFADQSHLTRHFRRMIGMTPGEFRRSQC